MRFTIRSVLLLLVLVCLLLGVYKLGQRAGFDAGLRLAMDRQLESQITSRFYDVSDLVMSESGQVDFAGLIAQITSEVAPDTWSKHGGPCSIQPFETNLSLVVSQSPAGHLRIQDYLQAVRQKQKRRGER